MEHTDMPVSQAHEQKSKSPNPEIQNASEQLSSPENGDANESLPAEMVPKDEVNRLVAEAEARGFLRGKNENAAMSMNTPKLWENPCRTAMDQESEPDPTNGFLSKIRPGVWD